MKTCTRCKKSKPLDQFNKRSRAKDGLMSNCIPCQKEYTKAHYQKNKAYYKAKAAKQRQLNPAYTTKYNLTEQQYMELLARYEGKCWICRENEGTHIDHDHACCKQGSCGKCVRGILCSHCNQGLGMFRDRTEYLNEAIKYLKG
ncbi:HNH endonuclease [Streptomyces phage Persimmon]|jgi:hypothetical protein|nr:HNH endonuclease [Streptomyces phage Persimmon]